jgi:N-acetylmuramoyl-L-alanine amidase
MIIRPVSWAVIVLSIILVFIFIQRDHQIIDNDIPAVSTLRAQLTNEQYKNYKRQIKCLADNIYYEAGNQSIVGKKAVAYVTLNRATSGRWPSDICDVVYQKTKNVRTGMVVCQFSWVCEKHRQIEEEIWNLSYNVARHVMKEYYSNNTDPTKGSNYYHATYVRPGWNLQKVVQIESHIFYK